MKIISGGQTGVDQLALQIATELGIETGGWAPKGWKTERGSEETLLRGYGLVEHHRSDYPGRTEANVKDADLTLIFTDNLGPGSKLTIRLCLKHRKPYLLNPTPRQIQEHSSHTKIVNVAGTRTISNLSAYTELIKECLISLQ